MEDQKNIDVQPPSVEPVELDQPSPERLLTIYIYADGIMHSRIQSFLLTQTFLILGYATAVAPWLGTASSLGLEGMMFLSALCVVGVLTATIQMQKMLQIHGKLHSLGKDLKKASIDFRTYIEGNQEKEWVRHGYTGITPVFIIALWVFLLGFAFWMYGSTSL